MSDMREETEDEISLLDLAITIKENIKLLVLAPIAAGVVALGGSFLIPPTFTASTSFANPAAVLGRALSDTFAGIAPVNAPGFVLAECVGGLLGLALAATLQTRNNADPPAA